MLSYKLIVAVVFYFGWNSSVSSSGPGPIGPVSEITDYNFSPYAPSASNHRPHHHGERPVESRYESSYRKHHRSGHKTNSALSTHSHTSRYIKNKSIRRPTDSSYYSSGSRNNLSNTSRSRKHSSESRRHTVRSRYNSLYSPKSRSHRRSYSESSSPSDTSRLSRPHSYPHYSYTKPKPSVRSRSSSYTNVQSEKPFFSVTSTGAPSTSFTPSQVKYIKITLKL